MQSKNARPSALIRIIERRTEQKVRIMRTISPLNPKWHVHLGQIVQ